MISGCLSVFYACVLQRVIGKLYRPDLGREWLTSPSKEEDEGGEAQVSSAALLIISAPFKMVRFSIFAFLAGLGVYQGVTWTKSLDTVAANNDSRDVFIVFVVGIVFCYGFFSVVFPLKGFTELIRKLEAKKSAGQAAEQMMIESSPHKFSQLAPRIMEHTEQEQDQSQAAGLSAALQAAAEAHEQCAKVDRQVALEYRKALARSSG